MRATERGWSGEVPQLGSFGKQQPPEPPRPVAVTFGTAEDKVTWNRQLFVKYLARTGRIGRDDMAADRVTVSTDDATSCDGQSHGA
jgi:hypothetical protein